MLSRRVKAILEDWESEIFISIASIWEIQNKEIAKNITLIGKDYFDHFQRAEYKTLNVKHEHIKALRDISYFYDHKDPFDRMLIAQSYYENLPIITSDEKFTQYKDIKVIVN